MKRVFACLFLVSLLVSGCSVSITSGSKATSAEAAGPLTNRSQGNDYKLVVQNGDPTLSTYIANAQDEFALVYPQLVTRWAADPRTALRVIPLQFVKGNGFASATSGGIVYVDLAYAHAHPYDPGVLTHELTHIVQGYPSYVVWLTEAIANYSSQLYGPRREDTFRSASQFQPDTTYLSDPYNTGSSFLFWLSQNKRSDIVDRLNRILQADKYTPQYFVQLTGETLDQLWAQYLATSQKTFTIHQKDPGQIYQSVLSLTPALTTSVTPEDVADWEIDQGQNFSCGFMNNVYNVSSSMQGTPRICKGLDTAGHNFAYQADMTIRQGNMGGIIGRGDGVNGLCFRVSSDGIYDLVNDHTTLLARGYSAAINQGQQKNTLLLVVEDKDIFLYVNGHYLGSASDTATGGGYFGLIAVDAGQSASVNYQNVKIWQW